MGISPSVRKTVPSESNYYKPVGSINKLTRENGCEQVFKEKKSGEEECPLFLTHHPIHRRLSQRRDNRREVKWVVLSIRQVEIVRYKVNVEAVFR